MVYVLNSNGQPLMPTNRYGKIRRLLKSGKAKVVKKCPFISELLGIKIPSFLLRRYSLASVTHTCQRLWTPQA